MECLGPGCVPRSKYGPNESSEFMPFSSIKTGHFYHFWLVRELFSSVLPMVAFCDVPGSDAI